MMFNNKKQEFPLGIITRLTEMSGDIKILQQEIRKLKTPFLFNVGDTVIYDGPQSDIRGTRFDVIDRRFVALCTGQYFEEVDRYLTQHNNYDLYCCKTKTMVKDVKEFQLKRV